MENSKNQILRKAFVWFFLFTLMSAAVVFTACTFTEYDESGSLIIEGKEAAKLLDEGYLLVDAQRNSSYKKEHIAGAVNIERKEIVVSDPVPNTLAPADVIARVAGEAGISETSKILIYDDNKNMDSSRLFWTLTIWGHQGDIKIVSGGLTALARAGLEITKKIPSVSPVTYQTGSLNRDMLAVKDEILSQIDDPSENFVLIDVRTEEEYNAGAIPGSLPINHERNLFVNEERGTTFRPYRHIRIFYKERGILPEDEIVFYCKSSVRATNAYAALYNAGYRNLKVYDGAWLEWFAEELPVFKPEVTTEETTAAPADNS